MKNIQRKSGIWTDKKRNASQNKGNWAGAKNLIKEIFTSFRIFACKDHALTSADDILNLEIV